MVSKVLESGDQGPISDKYASLAAPSTQTETSSVCVRIAINFAVAVAQMLSTAPSTWGATTQSSDIQKGDGSIERQSAEYLLDNSQLHRYKSGSGEFKWGSEISYMLYAVETRPLIHRSQKRCGAAAISFCYVVYVCRYTASAVRVDIGSH